MKRIEELFLCMLMLVFMPVISIALVFDARKHDTQMVLECTVIGLADVLLILIASAIGVGFGCLTGIGFYLLILGIFAGIATAEV